MNIDISKIEKVLRKLHRKDPAMFKTVQKKISQISFFDEVSIHHFKNLRHDSSEFKRVHIGSYILTFKIKGGNVIFERFAHHDDAYIR